MNTPVPSAEGIMVELADRLEHLIPDRDLATFCRRWQVQELSLFGSVLRDDFSPDSDIDVLISFDTDAPWSLWDLTIMQDQLTSLFGRPVDLVEREGLRNPFRRERILNTRKVIYAAGSVFERQIEIIGEAARRISDRGRIEPYG